MQSLFGSLSDAQANLNNDPQALQLRLQRRLNSRFRQFGATCIVVTRRVQLAQKVFRPTQHPQHPGPLRVGQTFAHRQRLR